MKNKILESDFLNLERLGFLVRPQKTEEKHLALTMKSVEEIVSSMDYGEGVEIKCIQPSLIFEDDSYRFNMADIYQPLLDADEDKLTMFIIFFDSRDDLEKHGYSREFGESHFLTAARCGDSFYVFDSEGLTDKFDEMAKYLYDYECLCHYEKFGDITNFSPKYKVFGMKKRIQSDYYNCPSFACGIVQSLAEKFQNLHGEVSYFNDYMQTFFCSDEKTYGITTELELSCESKKTISLLPIELLKYEESFEYLRFFISYLKERCATLDERIFEVNEHIVMVAERISSILSDLSKDEMAELNKPENEDIKISLSEEGLSRLLEEHRNTKNLWLDNEDKIETLREYVETFKRLSITKEKFEKNKNLMKSTLFELDEIVSREKAEMSSEDKYETREVNILRRKHISFITSHAYSADSMDKCIKTL